jgi:hypothetical protein
MDPRSRWILRPAGVFVVGTLVVLCGLAAAGAALAAQGETILRPDAPPSSAVCLADARPADRERGEGRCGTRSEPCSPSGGRACPPSHIVARPHEQPRQAAIHETHRADGRPRPHTPRRSRTSGRAPTARGLARQCQSLPATPITRISDGGPDRAITALAGTFLAMVALGAGCLTVAGEQGGAGALR